MSGTLNTSQDPDYVGPTGFEKKLYQTHFSAPTRKMKDHVPVQDDPEWKYIGIGVWRYVGKKRRMADAEASEVEDELV